MKKIAISAAVLLAAAGGYMGYTSMQAPTSNRLMIENIEALSSDDENPAITDEIPCWLLTRYNPYKSCIECSRCQIKDFSEGDGISYKCNAMP